MEPEIPYYELLSGDIDLDGPVTKETHQFSFLPLKIKKRYRYGSLQNGLMIKQVLEIFI
jgi:hypothetical protein